MPPSLCKSLAVLALVAACGASAHAGLTIDPIFGVSDTADFPGSIPITQAPNAATIEATIDAAIAQITSLVANPLTFKINFVDDPNTSLGESVNTGNDNISYTNFLSYLKATPSKSAYDSSALYYLPKGPGVGIDKNATMLSIGGANLDALGDTAAGNKLISQNGGYAGTIALNIGSMNISRKSNNPNDYDLVSTVTHEVDEILGIGGQGSTLGAASTTVGVMDLFRYSAPGVASYTAAGTAVSYFSITGGKADNVHFNQSSDGDYGDWGDGVTPADGQGNTPSQVQDAFGDPGVNTNMGRNEALALDVTGWTLTTAGLNLEAGKTAGTASVKSVPGVSTDIAGTQVVPEPGECFSLLLGGLALLGFRRRRGRTPRPELVRPV